MIYFLYSNHVNAQNLAENIFGNYALHLFIDSEEGISEEGVKKLNQTYLKITGNSLPNLRDCFFEKKIAFESLEKFKEFVLQYLTEHSLEKASIISMSSYNQIMGQAQHISHLQEKIPSLGFEIINPDFNEKKSLLGKLFS